MSPNLSLPFLFHGGVVIALVFFFLTTITGSPLSTVAISHLHDATIVCAFLPTGNGSYDLNCTSLPKRDQHNYPSGHYLYSAIAAGDGFLCGLTNDDDGESTMRWWDFTKRPASENATVPDVKRVYMGPRIADLSAGDYHVCGLIAAGIHCWRWPGLSFPKGMTFSDVAVGADFVCGIVNGSGEIKCVGNNTGIVGREPSGGQHTALAAGSLHACAVSAAGKLACWGSGAPRWEGDLPFEISSLALGKNRTCVLRSNGTVVCWGSNADPPSRFANSQFVSIQAKGESFCGILMSNFSLICWGSKYFTDAHLVFDRVLPGPCASISTCACGVLAGSGNLCLEGQIICQPCDLDPEGSPTAKGRRKILVFVVIGAVGIGIGLVAVALFLASNYKSRQGRESEAGRIRIHADPGVPRRRSYRGSGGRGGGGSPAVERRLTALIGKGPSGTIEQFPLRLLTAVTAGFAEAQKIGSGSFGSVYHATLPDGREVAIKRADPNSYPPSVAGTTASTSAAPARRRRDRDAAFLSELALLSRVNHRNLVRLLGFCIESAERVLVYEFMANGTLHDHLHKQAQTPPALASWHARLKLALDAARGIEYLHSYAVPPIIHRDIKSSNILLDDSWTAKVSDFGLSLLSTGEDKDEDDDDDDVDDDDDDDDDELEMPRTAGTVGYMDPEYYRLQHLTAKSDVYSFGVVLLELLSGCRVIQRYEESGTPRNVVEFAVPAIAADDIHRVLDLRLPPPTPTEIEAVAYVGYLAADCVNPVGRDRPTMTEVVGGLERAVAACATCPAVSRSITARLTPASSEKFTF
ncbi:serine/threonine-protein kinase-like protein CCR4 [Typha angustifolia]|uniref:serine/threonine-protein kinase-like protein CCR4 n=1 Tax=Typha angustifolia TaxID=59011 RepID=UPI003C30CD2E